MNTHVEPKEAIELIRSLCNASIRHYAVVNGDRRGSPDVASKAESHAISKVFFALTGSEPSNDDIEAITT